MTLERIEHRPSLFLALLLFVDFFLLLLAVNDLSICAHEARIVYEQQTLLHWILEASFGIFGRNDYGLRLPFIFVHLLNAILIYTLSLKLLRYRRDALLSVMVYLMLPGINSAALLASKAGFIIFLVLLFIRLYRILGKEKLAMTLLPVMALLDNAFAIMFLALFFFGLLSRDNRLWIVGLVLFGFSMYWFGFNDSGKPRGYFPDTFGVYAAIFSPLVFLYFFYAAYRILIKEEKTLMWTIVATALFLSLLLSFRQKIRIEDFAPFFVIGTPLMLKVFLSGLRVRLPGFRGRYRGMFLVVMVSLVLNFFLLLQNHWLYRFYDRPKHHFANDYHVVKELAARLQQDGFEEVRSDSSDLMQRLRFYGVVPGNEWIISKQFHDQSSQKVSIFYTGEEIASFYVTKIHN